jgi:hypothetical protein
MKTTGHAEFRAASVLRFNVHGCIAVGRPCDRKISAASPQTPGLRSLWRTFRHGDASLVGQQILQANVQRRIPA